MGTIYVVTIEGILLAFKWVGSGGGRLPIMRKMDTQNRKFSEACMTLTYSAGHLTWLKNLHMIILCRT